MKKIKFLALTLVAALSMGLTSCDKDKDINYQGLTLKEGEFVEVHDLNTDAKPIYKLHFKFGVLNGNIVVTGLTSKPEFPNPPAGMNDPLTAIGVMDFGKVKGLSLIESLPEDAAFMNGEKAVTEVKAEKKHGYVFKAWGTADFSAYGILYDQGYNDPTPVYGRLWVEKMKDGEYVVRCEYPWKPTI